MNSFKPMRFFSAILFTAILGLRSRIHRSPRSGRARRRPHPPTPVKLMESHIGNVTGHAAAAKSDYRRCCAGCHGDLGDANGENAVWLDPKPRDFTIATFKCRSIDRHPAHRRRFVQHHRAWAHQLEHADLEHLH